MFPTEMKAFLLSSPAQAGPRLVHTSGCVNHRDEHQTWLCLHKAWCRLPEFLRPPCLPVSPLAQRSAPPPCGSCASVQQLPLLLPWPAFTVLSLFLCDVPSHSSGFFLISSDCPDLEVSSPLPLLSPSPHLPRFSGLHLPSGPDISAQLLHLCARHMPFFYTDLPGTLAEFFAISPRPSTSSYPNSLLTGVGLLCSQQLCEEKRGGQGQRLRTTEDRETLPNAQALIPTPFLPSRTCHLRRR